MLVTAMKEAPLTNTPSHEQGPLRSFEQLKPSEKALAFACIISQKISPPLIAQLAHIDVQTIRPDDMETIEQMNRILSALSEARMRVDDYHRNRFTQNEPARIAAYQQAQADSKKLTDTLTALRQKLLTSLHVELASVNSALATELMRGTEDDV